MIPVGSWENEGNLPGRRTRSSAGRGACCAGARWRRPKPCCARSWHDGPTTRTRSTRLDRPRRRAVTGPRHFAASAPRSRGDWARRRSTRCLAPCWCARNGSTRGGRGVPQGDRPQARWLPGPQQPGRGVASSGQPARRCGVLAHGDRVEARIAVVPARRSADALARGRRSADLHDKRRLQAPP